MRNAILAGVALAALGLAACQSMGMGGSSASNAKAMQNAGITQQTNSNMDTPQGARAATALQATSPPPQP